MEFKRLAQVSALVTKLDRHESAGPPTADGFRPIRRHSKSTRLDEAGNGIDRFSACSFTTRDEAIALAGALRAPLHKQTKSTL
jgi:hypothetical protein